MQRTTGACCESRSCGTQYSVTWWCGSANIELLLNNVDLARKDGERLTTTSENFLSEKTFLQIIALSAQTFLEI